MPHEHCTAIRSPSQYSQKTVERAGPKAPRALARAGWPPTRPPLRRRCGTLRTRDRDAGCTGTQRPRRASRPTRGPAPARRGMNAFRRGPSGPGPTVRRSGTGPFLGEVRGSRSASAGGPVDGAQLVEAVGEGAACQCVEHGCFGLVGDPCEVLSRVVVTRHSRAFPPRGPTAACRRWMSGRSPPV